MAYGKNMKSSFYTQGSKADIAMPPIDEIPPVLKDEPSLWAGSVQEKPEAPVYEQEQEIEQEPAEEVEQEEPEVQEQKVVKTSSKEDNFKALREARERAEWERDLLKQQMLEMQKNQRQPVETVKPQEVEKDEIDFNVEDDALIEGRHAKKLVQEIRKLKQQVEKTTYQSSQDATEAKIRAQFPDFEDVVSVENVAMLNQQYPDVAKMLKDTPDVYSKASSAYHIMKRFGIYKDRSYDEEKMKAIKNSQKPRPLASVAPQQGDSPLSKANAFANGLTPELKAQMLKEMADARKRM